MRPWAVNEIAQAENSNRTHVRTEVGSSILNARLFQSVATLALENQRLTQAAATEAAQRERLDYELESAREVQQRLFPQRTIPVEGLDYSGRCRPAESVGGDFYDFLTMRDGQTGFAVADVSGKGVPAALLMAMVQASFRSLAVSEAAPLSALISDLNWLVHANTPINRYATLFAAAYDPKSSELTYVNCGHNAPMLFRGTEVVRLEEGGPPIGLFSTSQYRQATVKLTAGDVLVIYTDGVSEARNMTEKEFGDEHLIQTVRDGSDLAVSALIDHVFDSCDRFAGAAPQNDDMTLLIVRALGLSS